MKHRVARGIAGVIIRRPGTVAVILLLIGALSAWRVSKLHINYNQIELIPQELPSVIATKDMIDMIGAVGFLLMPLTGKDLDHTKVVADELAARLEALPEVRKVVYKQDVQFVRDRIPLYVQSADLKEAYKRIRKKIRAIVNKNNPFAIQLREVKEEPLNLDDIIDKYRRMQNKAVDDPYYVDKSYESIMLVIKPTGLNSDQDFLRQLIRAVEGVVHDYNAANTHQAKLVESYDFDTFPADATVTYGYTGSYKRNLDDSENIRQAIIPTSSVAFVGIIIFLFVVLRRPSQIALIMAILGYAVTVSFAFCEVVIGELNTVTALLGAILMGLGIDYGIHFLFRFREEFTRSRDLHDAISQTIEHSGSASIGCSTTTAAALYTLTISDFKGFADFGLVTGTGVMLAFVIMYVAIPTFYILMDEVAPSFKNHLIRPGGSEGDYEALRQEPYPFAKGILVATLILSGALIYSASQIEFDYDSRSLMAPNRPSVLLQDEISRRWDTSSDPVGIYTDTLDEARELFDHLEEMRKTEGSNINAVVSLFALVPPAAQQQKNYELLEKLKKKIALVTKDMIDDEKLREHWDEYIALLDAKPFTLAELPKHIEQQFRPIATSPYKGYLTYVYPDTSLWDGQELVDFADEVGTITFAGKTYHSAGTTVVFAQLARIVLRDGLICTLLSALAIFIIIWLDFRTVRAAALGMLPLLSGLICMLGLMSSFDWHINFMNIVVFPLVFGYGISAGVHLYHRYAESGSVMVAVRHTGAAVIASSVTTLIGWAALLTSDHRGLISMGILACFGIASTLLVSMTVLPALLEVTQRQSPEASAGERPRKAASA